MPEQRLLPLVPSLAVALLLIVPATEDRARGGGQEGIVLSGWRLQAFHIVFYHAPCEKQGKHHRAKHGVVFLFSLHPVGIEGGSGTMQYTLKKASGAFSSWRDATNVFRKPIFGEITQQCNVCNNRTLTMTPNPVMHVQRYPYRRVTLLWVNAM